LRYRHTSRSFEHAPEICKFCWRSFCMVKSKPLVLGLLSSLDYHDFQIIRPWPKGICCISVSPCNSFFLTTSIKWKQPVENPFTKKSFINYSFNSFPNPLDITLWYMKHICANMINVFKEEHITWLQKWSWYTSLCTRIRKCSFLNFNGSYKNTFMKHQTSLRSVIYTLHLCYGNWYSVLITELSILDLKLCNQFDVYDDY